eukprot:TRINITY_DN1047_c0_g1_i2.p1 TRINITY_DN1047_c0_g1~~TRINITY_DN1047_c0_g1_i2.p1  ORF type:complete len:171 (-),score=2.36 TRINITY_DN1047_c0_g1_i2:77-589(-)
MLLMFLIGYIFNIELIIKKPRSIKVDIITVITSLLPDLIDKPLWIAKKTSATRTYGHTILFLLLISLTASVFCSNIILNACDNEWIIVVFVGVLSHLLADLVFGYVPLFYPFQPFKYPSMIHTFKSRSFVFLFDLIGICIAFYFNYELIQTVLLSISNLIFPTQNPHHIV